MTFLTTIGRLFPENAMIFTMALNNIPFAFDP